MKYRNEQVNKFQIKNTPVHNHSGMYQNFSYVFVSLIFEYLRGLNLPLYKDSTPAEKNNTRMKGIFKAGWIFLNQVATLSANIKISSVLNHII